MQAGQEWSIINEQKERNLASHRVPHQVLRAGAGVCHCFLDESRPWIHSARRHSTNHRRWCSAAWADCNLIKHRTQNIVERLRLDWRYCRQRIRPARNRTNREVEEEDASSAPPAQPGESSAPLIRQGARARMTG